ncbi:MAG: T9SS type A sorting domain-containing protein [Calditrichaeota bacterium]|nr:T9SS type A sorting domain-containing protein [Calditrichota bacterium]
MKRLKIVSGIWSILISSMIFAVAGFSQVQVALPDTTATIGDTIVVPLTVSELPDSIYSYQFTLIFDSTVIRYLGFAISQTLSEQWQPLQPFANDKTAGKILVGDYGVRPLSGSGQLIKLSFLAVGKHLDSTEIHFDQFLFNSGDPPVVTSDGKIRIFAPLITVNFRANVSDSVKIKIDEVQRILPFDTTWYSGTEHALGVAKEQIFHSDTRYVFDSWGDGGDTAHIVVANADTIFQCNFLSYFYVEVQSDFGVPTGEGWYLSGSKAFVSVDSLIAFGDTTRAVFLNWEGAQSSSEASFSFAVTEAAVETANWQLQHFLTIVSDYGNPAGSGWYDAGDSAYFSVDAADSVNSAERFVFASWQGTGIGSYSGSDFASLVIMNHPITETADWRHEFYLQIMSEPDSLVEFTQTGWHEADTVIEIFTPNNLLWKNEIKYQFDRWVFDGDSLWGNPINVVMDKAHELRSVYRADSILVTIAGNFTDLPVYVDGARFSLPYQQFWQFESEHEIGVDSIVTNQDSASRFVFVAWEDGGTRFHQLRADSVLTPKVEFQRQFYLSIKTDPAGLWEFSQIGWHDQDDTVEISEAPEIILQNTDTLRLENWLVDGAPMAGNPISVVMDSAHMAIAQYNYWLTISGLILDGRGQPVSDVLVQLSGGKVDSVVCDENGYFGFYELEPGNYVVSPQADWAIFDPQQREVVLGNASNEGVNFVAIDTVKPVVAVLFPNGGEKLYAGDGDTLRWEASDNRAIDSLIFALSLDNGVHWQNLGALGVDFIDSSGIFLWQIPDSATEVGLARVTVIDFDGNSSEDISDGTFEIARHSGVKKQKGENSPAEFQLGQNYPNPFNNSTVIPFQLATGDHVVVEIFNFRGQRVARIFAGNLKAGSHEIRWNGRDDNGFVVGSGIYFFQIKTSKGKKAANKLLLLK